ncbi:hypothetical protein [Halomicrobium sp. LC1Hm]|uniref:hypothetical protein n=1 Tax=Halomicrobium sp. LC1Hm TaxID=2610902 RepID=UPI0012A96E47|nr:hypothetical protein [Halomicrobium sp. LC1Hm]QGA82762.1 hypothetical protein LC1Hm_1718 [Halomicrobium sp. LC1Hm]
MTDDTLVSPLEQARDEREERYGVYRDDDRAPLEQYGDVEPELVGPDGTTIDIPVTTKIDGILPWNIERDQTASGQTIVNPNGDRNLRGTIEGIIFTTQLEQLANLRQQSATVKLVCPMTEVLGIPRFVPDRLQVTRKADAGTGVYTYEGESVEEPLYTFQLQSKEQSGNNESFGEDVLDS